MKSAKTLWRTCLLFISILLVNANAWADYRGYYGWHMGPGLMGWGWGLGGMLFMLIFWILIIILIVLLIRRLLLPRTTTLTSSPPQEDSALDILKKRYARGEINKEEFEAKKKDLS